MNSNLFKKFLSFSYGSVFGLVIGLFGTMITTRILLPTDFGKASMFTLALNIIMIFVMMGTDQTFVRYYYEEKEENRGGLLYNCLRIPLLFMTLISTILIVFYSQVSNYLFEEESISIVLFLVLGILFKTIYRYSVLVIRMQQKGHLYSFLEILLRILNVGVLLSFYYMLGPSYKIIIYTTVSIFVILSFVAIVSERKMWSLSHIKATNLVHSKIDIFRFGSPLVVTMLITWLFQSFDKIAIKHWSNYSELGLYSAAFKIVALLSVLQTAFSTFWAPIAYEKYSKQSEDTKFFSDMSKAVTIAMFLVAIISIAFKDIIINLLGKNYTDAANIMPFLVFIPIMYTISETTVIGINFYKKPKWHILIAGISCITNIIGNWILVPILGAIGASISTAFAYVVFFTLRTIISIRYYYVEYNLIKIYIMLLIITVYSVFSIMTSSFMLNLLCGLVVTIFLFLVYLGDLKALFLGYKKSKRT